MIYLDNAGTTRPLDSIIQIEYFYNSSAGYTMARKTREMIENARSQVAKCTNSKAENIVFTSSATESNNQIIRSNVDSNKKSEYIFSEGEHPSVYNVALDLKNTGHIVKFIPLNRDGTINQDILLSEVNQNTRFISVMYVSNETGAINDIENIVKKVRAIKNDVIFHSDCVQALGKINLNFKKLGVDYITISSHKINGIKGTGAIICKNAEKLKPFILGGGQENNLRSGTENTESIVSFGMACQNIDIEKTNKNISAMRHYILDNLTRELGDNVKIVSGENCVPNIISVILKNIKSEVFVRYLDGKGVMVSKGSACSTKKSGNRILDSMGYSKDEIIGNLRISIGILNTLQEIQEATSIIIDGYRELRERTK